MSLQAVVMYTGKPLSGCYCFLQPYLGSKVHDSVDLLLVEDMSHKIRRLDVSFYELQLALCQGTHQAYCMGSLFEFEDTDAHTLKFGLSCVLWRLRREAQ